jgi:indolepyruvate ferredoxin oxidoreductase
VKRDTYEELVAARVKALREYQSKSYSTDYEKFVTTVKDKTTEKLAMVVAKNLFKLMAYKDEYEVARLHTQTFFTDRIHKMFEGDYKVYYHLAPPIFAARNDRGELVKQKMGPLTIFIFKGLKHLKFLRGTFLDVFGGTTERKSERKLISEYKSYIVEMIENWNISKESLAIQIANVPDSIKGYGHIKERKMLEARKDWLRLMAQWKIV